MSPFFAQDSLNELGNLDFKKTVFAFDFDGTLASIVTNPDSAKLRKQTENLLVELAKFSALAVITGRDRLDVKKRLGLVEPAFIVGNHGIEGIKTKSADLKAAAKDCAIWKAVLEHNLTDSGVEIEDKAYSLSVHYRKSKHKQKARNQIVKLSEFMSPKPRLMTGKCVFNFLPQTAPHKGHAILDLLDSKKFDAAFFIGDDVTDEDVFNLNDKRIFSVRVGRKKESKARFYIEKQTDIDRLLKILITFFKEQTNGSKTA